MVLYSFEHFIDLRDCLDFNLQVNNVQTRCYHAQDFLYRFEVFVRGSVQNDLLTCCLEVVQNHFEFQRARDQSFAQRFQKVVCLVLVEHERQTFVEKVICPVQCN